MKRTHLPLNAMRVFDAAARHLSFTRAADELAVTPAAVGQQIRALEDVLGVVLFRRTPRGLELTVEAEAGLEPLRAGFLSFEQSVEAMRAGQSSKALTIAAPRDVTARWLAPRLAAIALADPDLRFTLIAADAPLDFTEANLDLAVRWADGPGELEGAPIGGDGLTMIGPLEGQGDAGFALLWRGAAEDAAHLAPRPTLRLGDAGLAIDAAAAGLGQAVVPALLGAAAVTAGAVRPIGTPVAEPMRYWLVAPLPQWRQKKVQALVAALLA